MTFRMPAEWAPHEWTWIDFPTNAEEWPGAFDDARRQIADFANALHAGGRGEEVRLVAASEADAQAARSLTDPGVQIVVQNVTGNAMLRSSAFITLGNS